MRDKKAFSILELIVTCIIIGVMVSLAIPSYMTSRLRADEAKAMTTLYAYANAQKAFWFEAQGTPSNPNTYTNNIDDLRPFVEVMAGNTDDGDWQYFTAGDATTFTVTAQHTSGDGLEIVLHEDGSVDRNGAWPY